jgi:hypothetical protein
MRNLSLIALIVFTSAVFYGCGKSSSGSTGTTVTSSQWTLNGTTYKGIISGYDTASSLGILNSTDASGNSITIIFYSHPETNGTYTVSDAANSNDCTIDVQTISPSVIYTSTGKTGDIVNLTISGGKLNAAFTGVTVANGGTTTTTTGTVIQ